MIEKEFVIEGEIGSEWGKNTTPKAINATIEAAVEEKCEVLNVKLFSYGGLVTEGNQIYDLLVGSKDKGIKKVIIEQTGDICSIATKIFLAGDERIANAKFQFMIHAPFVYAGKVSVGELDGLAEGIKAANDELVAFYKSKVNMSEETLAKYMAFELFFSSEDAVKYGFATKVKTEVKAKKELALAAVYTPKSNAKSPTEDKQKEGLIDFFKSQFEQLKVSLVKPSENKKEVKKAMKFESISENRSNAYKKSIKSSGFAIRAMVGEVELEDGTMVIAEGIPDKGESLDTAQVFYMNEDETKGDVLPDGEYTLSSGDVITVKEGVVSYKETEEEKMEEDVVSKKLDAFLAKVESLVGTRVKELEKKVESLAGKPVSNHVPTAKAPEREPVKFNLYRGMTLAEISKEQDKCVTPEDAKAFEKALRGYA